MITPSDLTESGTESARAWSTDALGSALPEEDPPDEASSEEPPPPQPASASEVRATAAGMSRQDRSVTGPRPCAQVCVGAWPYAGRAGPGPWSLEQGSSDPVRPGQMVMAAAGGRTRSPGRGHRPRRPG